MAQISIKINGRSYDVACDDGQEDHVHRMGRYVDNKVAELAAQIGQVGDTRLLVMAALLITDELSEAYGELTELREGRGEAKANGADPGAAAEADDIRKLAQRIENIAQKVEGA